MIGTIVNAAAIIAGTVIGIFLNKLITENIKKIVFEALGLATLLIGFSMALKTSNVLIVIFSLLIGGIIGEIINIEKKIDHFGIFLKKKVKSKSSTFVEGFVTTSLLFCVGAMAIVGSIEDGINGNPDILYTKSLLDGFASVAFSSAMGIGVLFSFIPILIYQGTITILAGYAKTYLTAAVITEMSATGGLLIAAIGFNIMEIKKIKVGNLLPAIFVALALAVILI